MEIKKNRIGRLYGRFTIKELESDERKGDTWIKHTIEVYRWKSGTLSIFKDDLFCFIIDEDKFIKGIKRIPKVS